MGNIFISYSHKDSEYVHKLADTLQSEGFEVWIDDRIHYGSEWPKVVTRNLDASDGVIVVLSSNSYESDMVQNEVTRAREKKKPIFPLLLEGENWLIVQAKQFVDVKDGSLPTEKFYKRLEEISPRKKVKQEANEKAAREKTESDVAEQAAQEKAEREVAENIAREKAMLESAKKAKRQVVEAKPARQPEQVESQKSEIKKTQPNSSSQAIFWIIGITSVVLVVGLSILNNNGSYAIPTSFPTAAYSTIVFTSTLPLSTPAPILVTSTFANVAAPTTYSTVTVDSSGYIDSKGVPMRLIPREGTGSFYIDKYLVTNARYSVCVGVGNCKVPTDFSSATRSPYYNNPQFDNYPVIYVDWNMALSYCKWRGAQLPTEVQWIKAAYGTDGRTYPWGNALDCTYANYGSCAIDTSEVGVYESGKSPYGVYDMAGNVWEWLADLDVSGRYVGGDGHLARGGAFGMPAATLISQAANNGSSNFFGFRCVIDF